MSAEPKKTSRSARNATKHGLSSLRHLPAGREHELPPIIQELTIVRQPETQYQEHIVKQMALIKWQCAEFNKKMIEAEATYRAQAGERFDAQAEKDFTALRGKWLGMPEEHMQKMAESPQGVNFIINNLVFARDCLASGSPLTVAMARHMVRCEGVETSLQWLAGEGEVILRQALALAHDPKTFMDEWLEMDKNQDSATCVSRGRGIRQNIPDAAYSRDQLKKRVENRLQYWQERLPICQAAHEQARARAITLNSGFGTFDDRQIKQMQLLHRYSTAAQNRLKELNREYQQISNQLTKSRWREEDRETRAQEMQAKRNITIANMPSENRQWMSDESLRQIESRSEINRQQDALRTYTPIDQLHPGTDGNWLNPAQAIDGDTSPSNEIEEMDFIEELTRIEIQPEPIKLDPWKLPVFIKDPEPLTVVQPQQQQVQSDQRIQMKNLRNLEKLLPKQEKPPEPVVIAEYVMEIPANWREEEEKVKHLKPHVKMYEHLTLEEIKGIGEFVKHIRQSYPDRTKWLDRIEYYYKVELGERGLAPRR